MSGAGTWRTMGGMRAADEATLARRAAGGDGQAFAELYDAYESRILNFCLRLCGNREDAADATQDAFVKVLQRLPSIPADRELNFGAYLFTAARNASYDVIGKRKRADAVDEIPERGATPLMGEETGDVLADPERAAMLASFQTAVQDANARLPERQREVLVLRELEELSYDEIGEIMGMNRNAVAQLISRARIKLRDELRGSALAAVAVSSPDCERALPLLARRQDGQLADAEDRTWLDGHLAACATCPVSAEAMAEAGVSYRAWAPIVPMAWLWKATTAHAMDRTGFDWSDLLDRDRSHLLGGTTGDAAGALAGIGAVAGAAADAAEEGTRRRRTGLFALLGALLLLLLGGGVLLATAGDDPPAATEAAATTPPVTTTAPTATTPAAAPAPAPAPRRHRRKPQRAVAAPSSVLDALTQAVTTTQAALRPIASPPAPRPKRRRPGTSITSGRPGGKVTTPVTGASTPPVTVTTTTTTTTATTTTPPPPTTTTTTTVTTTTPPPTTTTGGGGGSGGTTTRPTTSPTPTSTGGSTAPLPGGGCGARC